MSLFRHGVSVGQKKQAQRGDVIGLGYADRLRQRVSERRRSRWAAGGFGLLSAVNFAMSYRAEFGTLGFWLPVVTSSLCGGACFLFALAARRAGEL